MPVQEKERKPKTNAKEVPVSEGIRQIQPILDALPFYVLLINSERTIFSANTTLLRDFGLSPEDVVGRPCPNVVHGCSSPDPECPLVEALERGEAVEREIFQSGSGRWLHAAVFPTSLYAGDGSRLYLHFGRDITESKKTEEKLSQSLEHHSALYSLLQEFQFCQTSDQILESLIDKVLSLSWLGIKTTAAGFLARDNRLEMRISRNLNHGQLARCKWVELGECLCGKVAQTGRSMVCSSASKEHTIRCEGMGEHHHAILPISHEGGLLGVLTLYFENGDEMNDFRLNFLKAAVSAAAGALANHIAREEVKLVREKSLAQVISYQEDERKRIAMELHDQVCQSLSALLLEMQAHGNLDESLRKIQQGCESRIRSLIDEVRGMAGQLRPTILDDYGLEMALVRHVEELSSKTGLPIDYQFVPFREQGERLPSPIEVGLYRVAVEALSNVISHSSASRASVVVLCQNSRLVLLVEDDGHGFDYYAKRKDLDKCLGLIGMEERIGLMGGTFSVESAPGRGTTVRADIPLPINAAS